MIPLAKYCTITRRMPQEKIPLALAGTDLYFYPMKIGTYPKILPVSYDYNGCNLILTPL